MFIHVATCPAIWDGTVGAGAEAQTCRSPSALLCSKNPPDMEYRVCVCVCVCQAGTVRSASEGQVHKVSKPWIDSAEFA